MGFLVQWFGRAKEYFIPVEEQLDSIIYHGQQYVQTDEIYRMQDQIQFSCVRPISNNQIIYDSDLRKERFYIRKVEKTHDRTWYTAIIQSPVNGFFWPSDVIYVPDGGTGSYAWVFPYPTFGKQQLLSEYLEQQNLMELQGEILRNSNEKRMKIVREILSAAKSFYEDAGLRYCSWRADQIYLTKYDDVYIDFREYISGYIPSREFDKSYHNWALYTSPYEDDQNINGDYFSLFVLIFYVLIGRFPYDGKLMQEMNFESISEQDYWNEEYRKRAVFIFDQVHTENSIGTFAHEQKYLNAWNGLNKGLKDLFAAVFRKEESLDASHAFSALLQML